MSRRLYGLLVLAAAIHLYANAVWQPDWTAKNFCKVNCSGNVVKVCKQVWQFETKGGCRMLPGGQRFRMDALLAHNALRENVTQGRTALPAAANMYVMDYDLRLEHVAQRFANTCLANYSGCDVGFMEEPLWLNAAVLGEVEGGRLPPMVDVMRQWTVEAAAIPAAAVAKFDRQVANNMTQVAWGRTRFVGCGVTFDAHTHRTFVYCAYWVRGNVEGEPMYTAGKPCSKCKYCNKRFKGLCGTTFDFPRVNHATAVSPLYVVCLVDLLFALLSGYRLRSRL